jgi:hypothetical protein
MGGQDTRKIYFWEGERMAERAAPLSSMLDKLAGCTAALRHAPAPLLIHEILDCHSKNCYDADGFSR